MLALLKYVSTRSRYVPWGSEAGMANIRRLGSLMASEVMSVSACVSVLTRY